MNQETYINILGRISHFFTSNKPLSILLLVAVFLFGLVAFTLTAKQYNPEITRPAFVVSAEYAGATNQETVDRVVYELVEKVRTVPGVEDVLTTVTNGGEVETTVIFTVGYDATKAKLDLWSEIEQHNYLARGFISDPTIVEINPETIPVLQIVFTGTDITPADLRKEVVQIGRNLGVVEDVSAVSVHGGYRESVAVELQPERLRSAKVNIEDVSQTLKDAQLRSVFPGFTTDNYRIELVLENSISNSSDLGLLEVRDGVLVRDVANIYQGVSGDRSYVWYSDGEQTGEAVVLAVSKVEGSSAPKVTKQVLDTLAQKTSESNYDHLSYKVVGDDGATAAAEIYGLTKNLLTSVVIVALVLMLFLSTRAASVVLVAIPVTLLIVFGLGWLAGETINRITLFALILSLGLLVDSSIVVVENIYAHLEKKRKQKSVIKREVIIAGAVHEIGIGLVISTITSVIVFIPMGFITGMMGPYMGPIAFFVPAALIVSLFVAIVITPFVSFYLLQGEGERIWLSRWFTKKLEIITRWYGRLLTRILSSRSIQKTILRSALAIFLLTLVLPLTGLVHFQMLPKADRDQVYLYLDMPIDANIERTQNFTKSIQQVLFKDDAVANIQTYLGEPPVIDFNGMFKGAQSRIGDHQATVRINLTPNSDRSRSSVEITKNLRFLLGEELPEAVPYVRFMEEPPGPPVKATFVAKVQADEQFIREDVAKRLLAELSAVEGTVDHFVTLDEPVLRTVYRFDHIAAQKVGVTLADTERALALFSGPVVVSEYRANTGPEGTPINLSLPSSYRNSPADITNHTVRSEKEGSVPLSTVLEIETETRPGAIYLEDVNPTTYATAEVSDRSIVYVVIDFMRTIIRGDVAGLTVEDWNLFGMTVLDKDTSSLIDIEWGGEWKMTLENFRDLGVAMAVALLLVYGVLVAQYRRFSTPAYILVTIPLGLVGILWGFFVLDSTVGVYLTATALIGFIALIGLVVNNAIIFLEYVEQARASGLIYQEALVKAGQSRLRPILLTSLTTVLASLTIASDPVWSGLAWAIVFGLSLSTIMTLVIYPTLLMYFTNYSNNK